MSKNKNIVLAAGGTGGHLFPAEALAEELLARGHSVTIITDRRGHAFKSLGDRVKVHCVRAGTLRPGLFAKLKAVVNMGIGLLQAAVRFIFKRPDVIVGFGGYPSFPTVFAGQLLGVPTLLHEQNAVLGKANVWLADRALGIATSLPDTKGIKKDNAAKITVTGNPVRASLVQASSAPYPSSAAGLNILITGGSQAAGIFSDVVPAAVARLPDDIRQRLTIIHQARDADIARTEAEYKKAGVKADIKSFFNDMADRLKNCHLFIGRSGASTVAEVAVVGRPAVFVPYPGHADMQQKYNAEVIAGKGGGWIMLQDAFTAEALSKKLEELAANPDVLDRAAAASRGCGQPDAAKNLAAFVEKRI